MIYLQSEEREFRATKTAFTGAFRFVLETMFRTYQEKGAARDVGSPIHHRQSPQHQVAMAKAKGLRLEALMSEPGWEKDERSLSLVLEEACDAANYLAFVGALCSMLLTELADDGELVVTRRREGTGGAG